MNGFPFVLLLTVPSYVSTTTNYTHQLGVMPVQLGIARVLLPIPMHCVSKLIKPAYQLVQPWTDSV